MMKFHFEVTSVLVDLNHGSGFIYGDTAVQPAAQRINQFVDAAVDGALSTGIQARWIKTERYGI